MKRYIVLSVNDNPDYLFHVPLTVWAWRKIGWEPILFYCRTGWTEDFFAVNHIEHMTLKWANIVANLVKHINEFNSNTVVQCSRLYGACTFNKIIVQEPEDEYLMTGDIDMLPLSDYWQPDYNKLTVWGRDLTDYHYPICYIGAPSETWREIMNLVSDDYNAMIKRDLRHQNNMWTLDQDLITEKINNSGFIPFRKDRGTDKRTGYPIGRIDRSNWRLDHSQFIDCHMFHDVHKNEESFKKTLNMLHTVWPKEDWSWWITYTKEFKKLCQNK